MTQKSNIRLDDLRKHAPLQENEEYIGSFSARSKVKMLWTILLGPLATVTMRHYQIMVTSRHLHLATISFLGKLDHVDTFKLDEVESVALKKRILTYRITFKFKNGRSVIVDANYKGIGAIEGYLFDAQLGEYLQKAVA